MEQVAWNKKRGDKRQGVPKGYLNNFGGTLGKRDASFLKGTQHAT